MAVEHPEPLTSAWACAGASTGTVTFTGTAARTGSGQSPAAASSAHRSQASASSGGYSTNGLHSPHPATPSTSAPSRTVMRRNRVVIAIA